MRDAVAQFIGGLSLVLAQHGQAVAGWIDVGSPPFAFTQGVLGLMVSRARRMLVKKTLSPAPNCSVYRGERAGATCSSTSSSAKRVWYAMPQLNVKVASEALHVVEKAQKVSRPPC